MVVPALLTELEHKLFAAGNLTTYNQDSRGLELSRTEAAGTPHARTITTTWHNSLRLPLTISEPAGNVTGSAGTRTTSFGYDARGNVLVKSITVTQGGANGTTSETRTWNYTYNSVGQLLTMKGPRSDVDETIKFAYDSATGNLLSTTDAAGNKTTYDLYDEHGRLLQSTDANGLVTTLKYDSRNRLIEQKAGGEITAYGYDGAGNLETLSLPDGTQISYTYDAAQRLTQVADSLGNSVTYTLDALGNRLSETTRDPNGMLAQNQTQTFDALGRLQKMIGGTQPASQITQYQYDAQGNLKNITDPLTHVTVNNYDALNRLTQVQEPAVAGQAAGVIGYGYDAQDNLARVTDQRGLVTRYTYSGFDELKTLNSPDTGVTTYSYDAAGNVKTMQDARGQTATYSYDALNRLKTLLTSDETLTFVYGDEAGAPVASSHSKGRLARLSDGSGNTQYAYNPHGQVIQKTQTISANGANTVSLNIAYSYNMVGQQATLTTASGQTIGYSYANNQITAITVNGQPLLTSARYFPFGEIKAWTFANGKPYQRHYDLDGRIQSVTLGDTLRHYDFDTASRIIGYSDQQGAVTTSSTVVGYDELDRLTSANKTVNNANTASQAYGYDLIGNRTAQTVDGVSSTLSYPAASNRLAGITTGMQTTTYSHDAAGNLSSDGITTYLYSGRNRLTQIKQGASVIARYAYNGFGERVAKTVGGFTTYFLYDEDGHLSGEYDQTGKLIQETVWLDDTPVATLRPTTPGQPISAANPLKVYLVWADHLDTPRVITTNDAANQVVWSWDSDPFGTTLASGSISYNLRFPGQYYDAETGLHYNYFRDYNPTTGRYVQSDPIGLAGGENTYLYVEATPFTNVDAKGERRHGQARPPSKPTASDDLLSNSRGSPIKPDRRSGMWNCAVVACCNDNIPGNCSSDPKQRCKQAVWRDRTRSVAINIAENTAKVRLGCQAKHVSVRCTGPKGQNYHRGG